MPKQESYGVSDFGLWREKPNNDLCQVDGAGSDMKTEYIGDKLLLLPRKDVAVDSPLLKFLKTSSFVPLELVRILIL